MSRCAVFVQENNLGCYDVVHELVSERLGMTQFIETMLQPFISRNLKGIEIAAIIGDPAGEKKNENDMTSCFDILHEAGFMIQGCSTNLITPRLEGVRNCLNTLVEGKAKLRVSRKNCPVIREGLLGGYEYKRLKVLGSDVYDNKPNKNFYSHSQDALQYIILYLTAQSMSIKEPVAYEPHLMRL